MKTLDVGCGNRPLGDVNVDIYKGNSPETAKRPCDIKSIPNFVLASGCFLPFRNEMFDLVISDNSMEHVTDYLLFLKEMLRVTKNGVIIKVPHRFLNINRGNPYHKQHFTETWFKRTLTKLGLHNFKTSISRYTCYPHTFFPLVRVPREITVEIFKRKRMI